MNRRMRLVGFLAVAAAFLSLVLFLLIHYRGIVFDRSREIAGGLTTGGWAVERDSLGVTSRGYFIIFKDDMVISNNLTYERVIPYAATGEAEFVLALGKVSPDFLAYSVQASRENDLIVLSAPIPSEPHRWQLFLRKVVEDTSAGNYQAELVGRWRIFGADYFTIDNPIRDGDSGTIEFFRNGEVNLAMDRPPEISYGLEFPDATRFGIVDNYLLLLTRTQTPVVYRIHSLGDLLVLERSEKVPWILVPMEE